MWPRVLKVFWKYHVLNPLPLLTIQRGIHYKERKIQMPSKYKLSPSASQRFFTCTASLPHQTGFSENKHTLKGNLQHEVAYLRLDEMINKRDHSKKIAVLTDPNNFYESNKNPDLKVKWDSQCTHTVDNYISYIKRMIKQFKPKRILLEQFVKMKFYGNKINGKVDCAMVLPNNDLIIIDLKTGRGRVETEDNDQMLMYAYGFIQDVYKQTKKVPKHIIISICQSLIDNTQAIKYSLEQVMEWYRSKAQPMQEINTDNLVYRPSYNACKYCDYKEKCKARIQKGVIV